MIRAERHISWVGLCVLVGLIGFWSLPLFSQEILHHQYVVDLDEPEKCVGCHDGSIAPGVSFCTTDCGVALSSSHPVYRRYPPPQREFQFAPRVQVEAVGIRLTNGEITCISCHDLTNQQEKHLVFDNTGSRLCLTCHVR